MAMGNIFNIQHFSLHDGNGIRTTVFFKGCPLDCVWCHNPESKGFLPQLAWNKVKCVGCNICLKACPNGVHYVDNGCKAVDFNKCIACGRCVEACPTGALEIMGRVVSSEEVLEQIEKDIPFYEESSGGVTLSGGEPVIQTDFALDILKGAKALNINTAIETAGYAPQHVYETLLPYVDTFLFDIKQTNDTLHQKYTGKSNALIHENLKFLCSNKNSVEVIVRLPVIPGYNDSRENYEGIAKLILSLERKVRAELLPYNTLAGSKHPRLGMVYEAHINEESGNSPYELCKILTDKGIDASVKK